MLTYDNVPQQGKDPLGTMRKSALPDVVDIGERNDCWMTVIRSKKVLELKDKATGKVTQVPIDAYFATVAAERHNLGQKQIDAARAALRL